MEAIDELDDHLEDHIQVLLQHLVVVLEHFSKMGDGQVSCCLHLRVEYVFEHVRLVHPKELAVDQRQMLVLYLHIGFDLLLVFLLLSFHDFLLVLGPYCLQVLQHFRVQQSQYLIQFIDFEIEQFLEELSRTLLYFDVFA